MSMEEKKEKVNVAAAEINSLINDVFELSCTYTKSNSISIRSYDELEKDIIILDSVLYDFQLFLKKIGQPLEKNCYTHLNAEDKIYRSFSYSFNAFIALWKSIICNGILYSYENEMESWYELLKETIVRLTELKNIIVNKDDNISKNIDVKQRIAL